MALSSHKVEPSKSPERFNTLKTELMYPQTDQNRDEVKKAIFEYIEVFYNREASYPPPAICRPWSTNCSVKLLNFVSGKVLTHHWKFVKKTVLYRRYYETFSQFKTACDDFFADLDPHHAWLRFLSIDQFQIIRQT
jgi:hypothetical protein